MTNPPTSDELGELYRDRVFTMPGNNQYYEDDRGNLAAARSRRRWIEQSVDSGRLLDVGCGFGHFLAVLDRDRWDARGIDLSPHVIGQARQRFDVRCEARSLVDMPAEWRGRYDVVTMWDVIEHLPDPAAALRTAASLLRPGGRLFLGTPDISAPVARLLGRRWHYIDPMQHLCLFSRKSLALLCEGAGLGVRRHRTFGRFYTIGYLMFRVGYCYRLPGLRAVASIGARAPRPLRDAGIPIRLGDILGLEAVKAGPGSA